MNAPHRCSPLERWPESDARGIFLCYVCPQCRAEKMAKYRPEVLTDPSYSADEQIEPDDWTVREIEPPPYRIKIIERATDSDRESAVKPNSPDQLPKQRSLVVAGPLVSPMRSDGPEEVEETSPEYAGTNITEAQRDAFNAIRDSECANIALFSCFVNDEPTSAIVAIDETDDDFLIVPLFVAVTDKMKLTDHSGQSVDPCAECGNPFDDNPGSIMCATCTDWIAADDACIAEGVEETPTKYELNHEEIAGARRNALAVLRHSALSCYWLGFDDVSIMAETEVALESAGTIFEVYPEMVHVDQLVEETPPPLYVRKASGRYRVAEAHEVMTNALDALAVTPGESISSPQASETFLKLKLGALEHEVFAVMFLDNRHRVLKFVELFRGTIDGTSVYPREVVKECLSCNAAAVILAHNHPSGSPEPSQADERITKRLKSALETIDVRVLDHVIVGGDSVVSFANRGLL